jgi:hypothetical protein
VDKLIRYQNLIKQGLTEYARLLTQSGTPASFDVVLAFDDQHGQYLLRELGWTEDNRIRQTRLHVALKNNKIWVTTHRRRLKPPLEGFQPAGPPTRATMQLVRAGGRPALALEERLQSRPVSSYKSGLRKIGPKKVLPPTSYGKACPARILSSVFNRPQCVL